MKELDSDTKIKDSKYEDWCVEDAARTLMRAEEIKEDPKMMKLVSEKLSKQKKAISSIQDLRDLKQELDSDDDEDNTDMD